MKIIPHVHFPATLYYDGKCPLCLAEVEWLRSKGANKNVELIDIKLPGFVPPENYTIQDLDKVIHMKLKDGSYVKGLDATYGLYAAVGLGWMIAPLRWRAVRYISDKAYVYFANNRQSISRRFAKFVGKKGCDEGGECQLPPRKN